jgi:hypothetical protein
LQRQDLHGAWCEDAGFADEYIKTRLVQLIGNLANPSLNGAVLGDVGDRQRYSTVRRGGKVVHLVVVERGAEGFTSSPWFLVDTVPSSPSRRSAVDVFSNSVRGYLVSSQTVHCVNHRDLHPDSDATPRFEEGACEQSSASRWDGAVVHRHREKSLAMCTSTSTGGGASSKLGLAK